MCFFFVDMDTHLWTIEHERKKKKEPKKKKNFIDKMSK